MSTNNFILEKLLTNKNMNKREIELLIIDLLKEKSLSPKNVREMFQYELHDQVRSAICRLCDKGDIKLDSDMILHVA